MSSDEGETAEKVDVGDCEASVDFPDNIQPGEETTIRTTVINKGSEPIEEQIVIQAESRDLVAEAIEIGGSETDSVWVSFENDFKSWKSE